jgi:uncharacterized phage protein (TIGR02220 family)
MRGIVKVTRRGRRVPNAYAIKLDTLEAMPTVRTQVTGTTFRSHEADPNEKVTGTTDHPTGTTFRSHEPDRPETDDRVTGTSRPEVTGTTFRRTVQEATAQRTADYRNGADAPACAWLDFLNREAGTSFKRTDANLRPIRARIREGHTFAEAERVVVAKTAAWRHTDKAEFLRPATIFGVKFDAYVQAATRRRMSSWDGDVQEGRL